MSDTLSHDKSHCSFVTRYAICGQYTRKPAVKGKACSFTESVFMMMLQSTVLFVGFFLLLLLFGPFFYARLKTLLK